MSDIVWLDVSIIRCPHCSKVYADASWYVLDMESDIECSVCGGSFNTSLNRIDRILIKMVLEDDKVGEVTLESHIEE